MKNNLKLIISFFVLSLITLVSSVFAWVNISKITNLKGPGGNIGDYTDLVTFEVKRLSKPELGYEEIVDNLDMMRVFGETKPGEAYTFRIKINNNNVHAFDFFANISNIGNNYSYGGNEDFDIREVFYIDNGEIIIKDSDENEIADMQDYNALNPRPGNNQQLNHYRLSNLMDEDNNSIALILPYTILPGESITIEFTLVYDPNTVDIGYQYNRLTFDGIYLYGQ